MYKKILISLSILLLVILVIVSVIYKNNICSEKLRFMNREDRGPLMDTKYKRIHKKNVYIENDE